MDLKKLKYFAVVATEGSFHRASAKLYVAQPALSRQIRDLEEEIGVDLFVRSSGEQRTSNFMLWQSAYAEMVFLDTLWPDFSRVQLWDAIELFARRTRRFGGAIDAPSV